MDADECPFTHDLNHRAGTANIKNQANEDVDLSKLSDTTMMNRIIQERIKLNMAKIIEICKGDNKESFLNIDKDRVISSDRYERLHAYYEDV